MRHDDAERSGIEGARRVMMLEPGDAHDRRDADPERRDADLPGRFEVSKRAVLHVDEQPVIAAGLGDLRHVDRPRLPDVEADGRLARGKTLFGGIDRIGHGGLSCLILDRLRRRQRDIAQPVDREDGGVAGAAATVAIRLPVMTTMSFRIGLPRSIARLASHASASSGRSALPSPTALPRMTSRPRSASMSTSANLRGAPTTMPPFQAVVGDQRQGLAGLVVGVAVLDQLEGRHHLRHVRTDASRAYRVRPLGRSAPEPHRQLALDAHVDEVGLGDAAPGADGSRGEDQRRRRDGRCPSAPASPSSCRDLHARDSPARWCRERVKRVLHRVRLFGVVRCEIGRQVAVGLARPMRAPHEFRGPFCAIQNVPRYLNFMSATRMMPSG